MDLAPGVTGAAGTHLGPIWSAEWNTLAQYPDGSYIWYNDALDGNSVQIRVRSVDVWGNEEVSINDAIYHLIVDNTAPKMAIALKNAKTGAVVTQVERNSLDGVLIEATGGGSVLVNDDLHVTYYYKLATDLNEFGSWVALDEDYGVPPTNDNPDYTRPYAFHWNTNGYRDLDGEPLIPNETYNISVEVGDLVCNTTDVVEHFTAGGTAPVKFVDTIAPKATIVHIIRDYSGADCNVAENELHREPGEHPRERCEPDLGPHPGRRDRYAGREVRLSEDRDQHLDHDQRRCVAQGPGQHPDLGHLQLGHGPAGGRIVRARRHRDR